MSLAVLYRSDARFDSAFRQIRSSSLGIVSSICRGGRASAWVTCSMICGSESASERSATGQQLVEDHAQAEDVRTPIDSVSLAPGLFGTHVRWSSSQSRHPCRSPRP